MGGTGGFNREQFAKKIYSNFEYKNKNRDRDIKEDVKKEFKRIEDRDENLFVHYRDDQQIWDAGINIIDNYILELKYSKGLRVDNEKFGIKDGKATLMKSENIYKNEALQYFTNARKKLREKYNATEGIKITSSDENRKLIHEVACDIDKAENEALKKIELKCNPKQEQQNAIEHSSVKKDKNGNVKVKTNNKGELEIVRQKPMFTQDNKGVLTFTDRSNQPKIHEALKGLFPKGKNYIYKINYKGCTNQNIKNKMMKLIGTGECYISYDEQTKTYLLRDKKGKPIQSRAIIWEGVTLRRDELIQWDTHEKEEERKENIGKIDASVQSDKAPEKDPELKDMIDDIPESLREKLKARGNEDYRRFIIETEKRLGEIIKDGKQYGYRLHSEPVTKLQISSGLMEVHFIHSETEFDVKVRENDDSKLKNTLGRGLYDFIDKHHESEYKTYLTKRINKLWNGKFSEIGLKDDLATEIKPNYNLEEDEKLPVETVKNLNYGIKILKKFIGNHRESEGDSWSDNDDRYLVSMEEEIENLEYTIQTRRDNTKNKDMLAIIDQSIDKLANSWGAYWSIHPEPEKTKIREVLFGDTKSNQIEALRKMAKGKRIFGDVTESSFLEDEISINGETVKTDKVVIDPETGEPLLDEEGNPIKEMTIQGGLEVEDSEINEKFQNINELLYTDLHYNDNNKLIGSEKQRQIIDELYSASADTTGGGIISILIKENMIPQGWDTDDDVKEKCKDIAEALREKRKTIDGLSINDMKSNEQKEKRELEMKSHKTEEDLKRLQALIYLEEHSDEANEIHETSLKKMQDEIKYGEINDLIRSSLAPVFVDKGGGAKGKNADTYNDIVGYGFRNLSDENVKIAGEILAEIVITVVVAVCTAGIGGVAVAGVLRGASMLARSARWVKLANNISKAVKLLKTGARGWKYANAAGKTTQVLGKGAALLIEGTTFNAASTMIHSAINGTSLDGLNLNPIAKENIQTAAFLGALSIGNKLGMKVISKLHGKTKIEAFSKAGLKDVIKNHKGIRTESLVSEATAMFGAEQGMNFIFGHDVIDPKTGDIETSRSFQRPTQQEFIQMIGMILAFKAVKPQLWQKYEQKLYNGTLEICRGTEKNEILIRDPKTGKIEKIQDLIDGKGTKEESPTNQNKGNQESNRRREESTRKKDTHERRKSELEKRKAELESRRQELLKQREQNRRSLDKTGEGINQITEILQKGNIVTIDGVKYRFNGLKNGKAQFSIDANAKKSAQKSGKSVKDVVEVSSLEELLDSRFNLEPGRKNTNAGRYEKLNEMLNNKVEPLDRLQNKINNKKSEVQSIEEEIARLEKGNNTKAYNDYFESNKQDIVGRSVWIDGVEYKATKVNKNGDIQFKERDGNKNFTVSSFEQLAQKGQVNGFSDGLLSDGSPRKGSETLTSHERTNHETIRNLIDGERSYLEGRDVQETINQQKSRLEQAKQELRGLEDKVPASQARQNAINERAQKGREINKELGKIETELGKVGREIDNVGRSISNRERELNELQESQPSEERASETPREQSRGGGEEPSKVEITDETLADEFDSQILNEGITINGDTYKLEYRENTTLNNNRKGEYVWTKNGKVIRKAKAETKTLPDNSNGNRIRSEYNRLREEYIHAKKGTKGTKGTTDTNTGNERVEASSENNPELVEGELNQELSKLGNGGNYENVKLNWVTKKMFETGVFIEGVHRRFKNLSLKPNLKMPKEFLRKIRDKLIDMKNKRGKNLSEQYRKLVDKRNKYLERKMAENGNEVEIKEEEIIELEIEQEGTQREEGPQEIAYTEIQQSELNMLKNLNKGKNEKIYLNEFGEPKNVIPLGNGENLYVSNCLQQGSRKFIVGYVKKGGEMKLRLFYRSQSEGARRSCPGETKDGLFSKGGNIPNSSYETTTRIPQNLQYKFDNLPIERTRSNPITLEGVGYNILEPEMISTIKVDKLFNGPKNNTVDYMRGHNSTEVKDFYKKLGKNVNLNEMKIVEGKGYTYEHQYLGTIEVQVCRLKYNGKDLDFSFAKVKNDPQNRVRVEEVNYADAKVSSFGIYDKQVNAAPLTGKPIDYAQQVPTDMQSNRRIGDNYVDIRDLYQENPFIKKFKEISKDYKKQETRVAERKQKDEYFNGKSHEFDVTERQAHENSKKMDKMIDKMDGKNEAKQIKKLKKEIAKQYKKATGKKIELTDEQVRSIIDAHKQEGTLGEVKQSELLNKDRTLAETIADKDLRRFLLEAGFCGKNEYITQIQVKGGKENALKDIQAIKENLKKQLDNLDESKCPKDLKKIINEKIETLEKEIRKGKEIVEIDFDPENGTFRAFGGFEKFVEDLIGRGNMDQNFLNNIKLTIDYMTKRIINVGEAEPITLKEWEKRMDIGDNFMKEMEKHMINQWLDNPQYFNSHGFDHTILVHSLIVKVRNGLKLSTDTIAKKYGLSQEKANKLYNGLIELSAALHDLGYPAQSQNKREKTTHATSGAELFYKELKPKFEEFITKEIGLDVEVAGDLACDMYNAVCFHGADKVECHYVSRVEGMDGKGRLYGGTLVPRSGAITGENIRGNLDFQDFRISYKSEGFREGAPGRYTGVYDGKLVEFQSINGKDRQIVKREGDKGKLKPLTDVENVSVDDVRSSVQERQNLSRTTAFSQAVELSKNWGSDIKIYTKEGGEPVEFKRVIDGKEIRFERKTGESKTESVEDFIKENDILRIEGEGKKGENHKIELNVENLGKINEQAINQALGRLCDLEIKTDKGDVTYEKETGKYKSNGKEITKEELLNEYKINEIKSKVKGESGEEKTGRTITVNDNAYEGRFLNNDGTGLEYRSRDLMDDPLMSMIRIADNLDMAFNRLIPSQSNSIFITALYNLENGGEIATLFQKMEKFNKKVEKGEQPTTEQEIREGFEKNLNIDIYKIFEEKGHETNEGRDQDGKKQITRKFNFEDYYTDGKFNLGKFKQDLFSIIRESGKIKTGYGKEILDMSHDLMNEGKVGSYSVRHMVGLRPIENVYFSRDGAVEIKIDMDTYFNSDISNRVVDEDGVDIRLVEYHLWREGTALKAAPLNGENIKSYVVDKNGKRIGEINEKGVINYSLMFEEGTVTKRKGKFDYSKGIIKSEYESYKDSPIFKSRTGEGDKKASKP